MRWFVPVGCVALGLAAVDGAARGCPIARQEGERQVVPSGGGVLVEQRRVVSGCRMMMVGGGARVPLRPEDGPAADLVFWSPTRPLEPGVLYEVIGVDEDGERVRYLEATAGSEPDRVAPEWRRPPRVVATRYRAGCLLDDALVDLALEVVDRSMLRVTIEARPVAGGAASGRVLNGVLRPEWGPARVTWPVGDGGLEPGVKYAARACAEDVAGNRSCALEPAEFTAPGPGLDAPVAQIAAPRERDVPPPTAPPAVEDRLERARPPRARVDWRWTGVGAAGAALVLVVAALGTAALRRLSRAAAAK